MDDQQPADPATPELRLALAMRGGVSLAVWIGGSCAEIDELRRGAGFWGPLTEAAGYSAVVVDVMAGASAGGLNAVLFGASIRNGFPMKGLLDIWKRVASVDRLRRTEEPWLSLFDGDAAFLGVIRHHLREQIARHPDPRDPGYVDVQLSATLVEPLQVPAPSPQDERLWRARSSARFHFRHDTVTGIPRADFDPDPSTTARLALAARATSSFPGAFEPAVVRSTRPEAFGDGARPSSTEDLVDCRGVFSEARGRTTSSDAVVPEDFVVADGGIVDNIPLGKALEAVAGAPAGGRTRRVLVYLHPDGPAPGPGTSSGDEPPAPPDEEAPAPSPAQERRRSVLAVAAGAKSARVQGESIEGDLERLEFLNRAARMAEVMRQSTLECFGEALWDGVEEQWATYTILRPAADAAQLRGILDDPVVALGQDPFPHRPDEEDDRWRAPLSRWGPEERLSLDGDLTSVLRRALAACDPGVALLGVGISPLRRSIDLVLEWTRSLPPTSATVRLKRGLYEVRSVVNVAERARRYGWVVRAARGPGADGESVAEWCSTSIGLLDQLLVSPADVVADPHGELPAHLASTNRRLQELVDTGRLAPVDGVDLRQRAVRRLAELVDEVLVPGGGVTAGLLPDSMLHRVLTTVDRPAADRIAALEVLCLPEHLAGRPGAEQLQLVRISAASFTPVATHFRTLREASGEIDGRLVDEGRGDEWVGREDFLRPQVKLAGNELSNFSAFLDPSWRDNDWLWGRLDAVSGLVDILLDRVRPIDGRLPQELRDCVGADLPADTSLGDLRARLIAKRQEEILAERFGPGWRDSAASYDVGLQTVTDPGDPAIQDALVELATVGSRVLGGALPASLAGLASIAGHAGRLGTRQLARPKGEIGAQGRRVRSRTRATPVRAPGQASRPGGGGTRRSLVIRTALWLVPLLAGVVLAVAAWALDGWASLLTAIAAGVFVGLALPPFLLLAVLWNNPPRPAGRPPIPPEGSEG